MRCRRSSSKLNFSLSAKASDYHKRLSDFMIDYVFPAEAEYEAGL